jgi:replicative DNA helicase
MKRQLLPDKVGKMPPHDILLEKAILGACLLDKTAFSLCRTFIVSDTFYMEKNTIVFLACEALFSTSTPIDLLTVANMLRSTKTFNSDGLKNIGGVEYLGELVESVSSATNLETHCRVITEKWMRRLLIKISSTNTQRAFDETYDIFDLMAKSQMEINKITERLTQKKTSDILSILYQIVLDLEKKPSEREFVPFGIAELDAFCRFSSGDLITIGARPGMGKTSLACYMMLNGMRGLFFSLEMQEMQIVQKILSSHSGVPYWKIKERACDPYEKSLLQESYSVIKGTGISSMVQDSPITVEGIRANAVTEHLKKPIDFIIVDYLQFVKPSKGFNRDQQIGHITSNLKYLAKELKIPVIELAQLSRGEGGIHKKPQLTDLRESGNIEQDSDVVIFPYRPEYYGITEDEVGNSTKNKIEMIYAKNRHGGLGSIMLNCDMPSGRFFGDVQASSKKIYTDYTLPFTKDENVF